MNDMLKKLQFVEYDMLKDIASFCDQNHIKYFLIAGTLLGAVRHGGFIPWDDDIDIGMDLKNFRRFLRIAKEKLPEKYFLQHFTTDKKVNFPWIKIRINNTTCMLKECINYDIHSGVGMDIFLLNGISKNRIRRYLQNKANKLQRVLIIKYYNKECKNTAKSRKRLFYQRIVPEFIRIPLISFLGKITEYDLNDTDICFNTYYMYMDKCFIFESNWFTKLEKIQFEDDMFWAPVERIRYLETRYGEWQEFPPENERVGHGDLIIDLDNDYSQYYKTKV